MIIKGWEGWVFLILKIEKPTPPTLCSGDVDLELLRILLHCEVNDSQVVKNFPFKWRHVRGSLETAYGLRKNNNCKNLSPN